MYTAATAVNNVNNKNEELNSNTTTNSIEYVDIEKQLAQEERRYQDSFSMLTEFMSKQLSEIRDELRSIQHAQAGMRQQMSEVKDDVSELLYLRRMA